MALPGRTRTFPRVAILTHVDDHEDGGLAEQRLATPARRWSHEDLEAEVDLDLPRREVDR